MNTKVLLRVADLRSNGRLTFVVIIIIPSRY